VKDSFTVNWTLFPIFDKNIEYAIECISIGMWLFVVVGLCEDERGCKCASTTRRSGGL